MNSCIVNYSDGAWYPKGQARLVDSLQQMGWCSNHDILLFNSKNLKCPSHTEVSYAFKPYSIMRAKELGYTQILWVDSSFWAIKSIDFLFELLAELGNLFQNTNQKLGTWCSDRALSKFGIDRDLAFNINLYSAGFTGLDLSFKKSDAFLTEWYNYANDGVSFHGAWNNKDNCVSTNTRVAGHRHDMSVASFLAYKLEMPLVPNNTYFAYYSWYEKYENDKKFDTSNICFLARGM